VINEDVVDDAHTVFHIRDGKLTSESGAPAIECIDGHIEFWKNGIPSRSAGAVVITAQGEHSEEPGWKKIIPETSEYRKLVDHVSYYDWFSKQVRTAYMQDYLFFQSHHHQKPVLPYNPLNMRRFHDLAAFLMQVDEWNRNFQDSEWFTIADIRESRWRIKANATGIVVPILRGGAEKKTQHFYHVVFNRSQLDTYSGVQGYDQGRVSLKHFLERIEADIVTYDQDASVYDDIQDRIYMPNKTKYKSIDEYYSNLTYELVRWTGHPRRLNRPSVSDMQNSRRYANECMIGDLASHELLNLMGLKYYGARRNNDYRSKQVWFALLEKEPKYLLYSVLQARESVKYLLSSVGMQMEDI
jgi:hypothetical protein